MSGLAGLRCGLAVLCLGTSLAWAAAPVAGKIEGNSRLPDLTEQERAWLGAHPVLRVGIDRAWPPLEFVDDQGRYSGMAVEFLRIVERRLGIELRIEKDKPWAEVIKAIRGGGLDALSLVVETPQRQEYLRFTDAYLSFPYVIVTLDDKPFVDGIAGLAGRAVSVVRSYAIEELLSGRYPDLPLHLVDSVADGLDAVITGRVYAFVGNLAVVTEVMREQGITNLKVSGQTEFRSNLAMAFRKELAGAVPIFNKALGSVTPAERNAIYSRWIRLQYDTRVDPTMILILLMASILVVSGIVIWNRQLRAEIARRSEAEVALEAAKAEAEAANQAKSEFLATMSHEIRTPMNGVLGMVGSLLSSGLSLKQKESVQIIKDSGEALLEMLNAILDISKIEAGRAELECIDLSVTQLLDSTLVLWQPRARDKGLKLRLDLAIGDGDVIRSDPGRIKQVLFNLVSNAIKFTDDGEVVIVVSEVPRQDDHLELRFDVRDSGIGIEADALAKLFQPFSQADMSTTRKYGGTGLGLSISKRVVELMGGEIGVESAPGRGSRFWFTIVAEPGDPSRISSDQVDDAELEQRLAAFGRDLRVLVVEDVPLNQQVVEALLRPLPVSVDFADDGRQALEAVRETVYDAILMDIHMPEMDGPTATRQIRALPDPRVAGVPIIALTANAMKGDRERFLAAGMDDYLSKPISKRTLLTALLRCLEAPDAIDTAVPLAG